MEGIEKSDSGTTFTGAGIEMLRLTTMLRCLKMEIKGFKMVRHSVYAQVKREMGFKGNKQAVYDQLMSHLQTKIEANKATMNDVDSLLEASR